MPAVTFKHSTIQSSQNCGVVIARSAVTLPVVTIAATAAAPSSRPAASRAAACAR